ncbi:MAG: glycosyltransferase family 2 protein [Gammaproteobacteria bacterium]
MGVAAIVPTFNRREELRRALDSIYRQTRPPEEVIVIDDGSTDGTGTMLKNEYPTVIYRHQENAGVSRARNRGIELAESEWLAFLDSDDEWLPAKLESQFALLDNGANKKICHTEEIWIRNGSRVNPMKKHAKKGGWIFSHCLPLCAMSPSSIVIHRDVFEDIGFFDENLPACEDYDLWLRITARYPVSFVEEPMIIKYGGHEDQLSRRYWGMDRFRIRALERLLTEGGLSEDNRRNAAETLVKKAAIYLNGALRREKMDEAAYYEQLIRRYS